MSPWTFFFFPESSLGSSGGCARGGLPKAAGAECREQRRPQQRPRVRGPGEERRHRPGCAAAALGAACLQHFAPSGDRHRANPRIRCSLGARTCPRETPRLVGLERPATDSSEELSLSFGSLFPKVGPKWKESALIVSAGAVTCATRARAVFAIEIKASPRTSTKIFKQRGLKQSANPFCPPKIFAAACLSAATSPASIMNE